MKINLNDHVEITLNPEGARVYSEYFNLRLSPISGSTVNMLLWEAFHIFGPTMTVTSTPAIKPDMILTKPE